MVCGVFNAILIGLNIGNISFDCSYNLEMFYGYKFHFILEDFHSILAFYSF